MFKKCITKLSVITIFALISLINFAYAQDGIYLDARRESQNSSTRNT